MDATMANSHYFVTDFARQAAELVDDAASAFRNRGHTREHAVKQAALALGIPESRAKGLIYGKVFAVSVEEFKAIRTKYLTHLDEEADCLALRSAAARTRRKQIEMDMDL